MEQLSRSCRTTAKHQEIMLDFFKENPELISNKFVGAAGKQSLENKWKILTTQLNACGYGIKTTKQWQRSLQDSISKAKLKYAKLIKERQKTGGGEQQTVNMTHFELELIQLKGLTSVEGDGTTVEFGLPKPEALTVVPEMTFYDIRPVANVGERDLQARIDPAGDKKVSEELQEIKAGPSGKKRRLTEADRDINTKDPKRRDAGMFHQMHCETLQELKNISSSVEELKDAMVDTKNTLLEIKNIFFEVGETLKIIAQNRY